MAKTSNTKISLIKNLASQGYTLVEVTLVLVIASGIFISAVAILSARQRDVEFAQAVRELDSRLQDVINDVGTGFFPESSNVGCKAPLNDSSNLPPDFSGPANAQGQNEECIFLGKAAEFRPAGIDIYTVAARRTIYNPATGRNQPVNSLAEAKPVPIDDCCGGPELTDKTGLRSGLEVRKLFYKEGATIREISTIGFFSGLGRNNDTTGRLESTNTTDFIVVPGTSISDVGDSTDKIIDLRNKNDADVSNPEGGVTVCLMGSNGRLASISIGGNSQSLGTEVVIDNVPTECTT